MRSILSRWFLFGLLLGWSLGHATVFGQSTGKDVKPASPVDKLRQSLDKTITVDFTGQTFVETLNHLRDRAGLKLRIDDQALAGLGLHPGMNGGGPPADPVHVKATNEKAGQVLRKFLGPYQLCFILIDDAILITAEDTAVMRQMRQRVSIDFDEVPLKKAVRELAKSHGVNLVIDPKVLKQSDTPVSLQLENTGIETALRLLAEMASLKAVRMGNVMFITSEEKAKKIRDEEQHQFDNPLNPNMPMITPIVGALMGGGFGGQAPPRVQIFAPPGGVAPPPPIEAAPAKPIEPEKIETPSKVLPPLPPPPPG
jgi:hypothetical protein